MVGSWQEPTEKKTCVLGTLLSSPTINCTPLVPPTSSQVKDVICSGLHPASRGQALKHVSPRLRNVQEVSGCPFAWHWMNFIKSYYVLPLSEVETPSVKAKPLKKLYCNPIPRRVAYHLGREWFHFIPVGAQVVVLAARKHPQALQYASQLGLLHFS